MHVLAILSTLAVMPVFGNMPGGMGYRYGYHDEMPAAANAEMPAPDNETADLHPTGGVDHETDFGDMYPTGGWNDGMEAEVDQDLDALAADATALAKDMAGALDQGVSGDVAEANDEEIAADLNGMTEDLANMAQDIDALNGDMAGGMETEAVDQDLTNIYGDMAAINGDMAGGIEQGTTALYGDDVNPEDMAGEPDAGLPHNIYEGIMNISGDMTEFNEDVSGDMDAIANELPGDSTAEGIDEGMYQGMEESIYQNIAEADGTDYETAGMEAGIEAGIEQDMQALFDDLNAFGEDMAGALDQGVSGDMTEANDEEISAGLNELSEDLTNLAQDIDALNGDMAGGMGSGSGAVDQDLTDIYGDMAKLNGDVAGAIEEGTNALYGAGANPEDMAGEPDAGLPPNVYEHIMNISGDMAALNGDMAQDLDAVANELPGDTTVLGIEEGMEAGVDQAISEAISQADEEAGMPEEAGSHGTGYIFYSPYRYRCKWWQWWC